MTDPFVCVPMATGTSPEATAAAEPADEPPGVCSEDSGFLVRAGFKNANSVVSVLPNMTAPAASSASTKTAFTSDTSPINVDPHPCGIPSISMMSFTPTGHPCKLPKALPSLRIQSNSSARFNARSSST